MNPLTISVADLTDRGPIIHAAVSAPGSAVVLSGKRMLIDTGAGFTSIDPKWIIPLDIDPAPEPRIFRDLSGKPSKVPAYWIGIEVADVRVTLLAGAIPQQSDCDLLLGRDFLSHCVMTYDGPSEQITLNFRQPKGSCS